MRYVATAVILIGLCLPAAAQQSLQERCQAYGKLAAEIMRGRQNDTVMSSAMAPVQEDTAADQLVRALIIEAYKRQKFLSDENKETAVVDFRNETELACYTSN